MTVAVAHRVYLCARCGKRATADRMVFSRFTRNHYCVDIPGCEKRARRNHTLVSHRNTTGRAARTVGADGGAARKDGA